MSKKPLTNEEIMQMWKEKMQKRYEMDIDYMRRHPDDFYQDCEPTFEKGAFACKKIKTIEEMDALLRFSANNETLQSVTTRAKK